MDNDLDLAFEKSEMHRLLGLCLLKIQMAEKTIKQIYTLQNINLDESTVEKSVLGLTERTKNLGMGQTLDRFIENFIIETEKNADEEAQSKSINLQSYIIKDSKEKLQAINDLKNLVAMRNRLVHNLLDRHETWKLNSIIETQDHLKNCISQTDQQLNVLRSWKESISIGIRFLAENLDYISQEPIKSAIHEAYDRNKRDDGWCSVNDAKAWISKNMPYLSPSQFECTTWQQAIHELKEFTIKTLDSEMKKQKYFRPSKK
ncbi:OST-HTH/LOTUS domain-containing protein [Perlucidibaca piscinae]|uniref:OST-HTH/LOTUS domain-containing protein n=1 Tax=Perlucidibaca piscinae TaxID=392589 RepID=UPI0012ECAA7A|nr:OST-HTH/LOTUS domain-containing protein [Perlucidibaca piscinae]